MTIRYDNDGMTVRYDNGDDNMRNGCEKTSEEEGATPRRVLAAAVVLFTETLMMSVVTLTAAVGDVS